MSLRVALIFDVVLVAVSLVPLVVFVLRGRDPISRVIRPRGLSRPYLVVVVLRGLDPMQRMLLLTHFLTMALAIGVLVLHELLRDPCLHALVQEVGSQNSRGLLVVELQEALQPLLQFRRRLDDMSRILWSIHSFKPENVFRCIFACSCALSIIA